MKYLLSSAPIVPLSGPVLKYYYDEKTNNIVSTFKNGHPHHFNIPIETISELLDNIHMFQRMIHMDKDADKIVRDKIVKDNL